MSSELLAKLNAGAELSGVDVAACCQLLLDEGRSVESRAEILAALSRKGETPAEIAWFVRTLLAHALPVHIPADGAPLIDVCGTGGDQHGLFNISTATMFVAAACGMRVVKHGNRGVTSKCGGADVLEALGIRIELQPDEAARVLADVGCVFLFAPTYHPAFKAIGPVRKHLAERGIRTVFNKIGPLLNPVRPPFQLAGVFDPAMVDVYGAVFAELGRTRAWAVHGKAGDGGGLDEMSTIGVTNVCEVDGGNVRDFTVDAHDCGIPRAELSELVGGDAKRNADLLEGLLRNRLQGAIEDMVVWNCAGALVVAEVVSDLRDAVARARSVIRDGSAAARLDALRVAAN